MPTFSDIDLPSPKPVYDSRQFDDCIDYARELEDRFGVRCTSRQLSEGASSTRLQVFELMGGDVVLSRTSFDCSQYIEFEVPEGYRLVSLCASGGSFHCNGLQFNGAEITVYRDQQTYTGTYPRNWDAIDLLIRAEACAELGIDRYLQVASEETLVATDSGPLARAFLDRANNLFNQAEDSRNGKHHFLMAAEALGLILGGIRPVLEESFQSDEGMSVKQARRHDLLEKAQQYLEEHSDREVTIDEIREELGVTYRLMHYSFSESLAVSPYQFLLVDRLHKIRDSLKTSDISVKDACYAHGFNTPSRFRRQYKRLFGELPSETRAKFRTSTNSQSQR